MFRDLSCLLPLLGCLALSCGQEPAEAEFSPKKWIEEQKKAEPTYAGPKVRLAPAFPPGSYTLTESVTTKNRMKSTETGETHSTQTKRTITGDVLISPPGDDGVQTVRYTCRRIQETNSTARGTVSYDSANPVVDEENAKLSEELAARCEPFVGWAATLRVQDGRVIGTEGLEDLMAAVAESSEGEEPDETLLTVRRRMQRFLKQLLTQRWGRLLPDEPVGPGDTWERTVAVKEIPFLGPGSFQAACLLEDIEQREAGKIAVLRFAIGTVVRDQPVDLSELGSQPVKGTAGDIQFQSKGTARFDLDLGLSRNTKLDMQAKGDLYLRGPEANVRVDFEVDTQVQTTLEPRAAAEPPGPAE